MSDLFFSKNKFVQNSETRLAKPLANDPTKLGRKTVDQVKQDMHPMNNSFKTTDAKPTNVKDIQLNQSSKLSSLHAFKEWNKKWKLKY